MNNEEKILKYIDNQLTEEEREAFEEELRTSETLRKLFDEYKNTLNEINSTKNIQADEKYIINLIPQIKERTEKEKLQSLIPNLGWAFSIIAVLIIGYFLFFTAGTSQNNELNLTNITAKLNTAEKINLLEEYLNSSSESYLSAYNNFDIINLDEIINEVNKEQLAQTYSIDIYDLQDEITEEEIDEIYNKLVNKNFNNEVN